MKIVECAAALILSCMATTHSLSVRQANRYSIKSHTNSLHAPEHSQGRTPEENYFNPDDVVDVVDVVGERADDANDAEIVGAVGSREFSEENLIDQQELNQINQMKNAEMLQNLQRAYAQNGHDNEQQLLREIKKILSLSLHIPEKEVNLHDINVLIKKWKIMNRTKQNAQRWTGPEIYTREVREHGLPPVDVIEVLLPDGVDRDMEQLRGPFIRVSELFDLIQ